jgi:hypothetical protein
MSSNDVLCTVIYYPQVDLPPFFVSFNYGQDVLQFNCQNCFKTIPFCCDKQNLYPSLLMQYGCYNCACQIKPVASEACGVSFPCGSTCGGSYLTCCQGRTTNVPVHTPTPVTESWACSRALAFLEEPFNYILNGESIRIQCNPALRLQCCQGIMDATVNQVNCALYWGPNNFSGDCDQIMINYCNANPNQSICDCIIPRNNIVSPECNDVRCRDTNAMKTSFQLNNQCNGVHMTCTQYVTVDATARFNIIDNVILSQTCNVNYTTDEADTNAIVIGVAVGVGVIVVVILIIVGVIVGRKKPNQKKPKTSSEKKQIPNTSNIPVSKRKKSSI